MDEFSLVVRRLFVALKRLSSVYIVFHMFQWHNLFLVVRLDHRRRSGYVNTHCCAAGLCIGISRGFFFWEGG